MKAQCSSSVRSQFGRSLCLIYLSLFKYRYKQIIKLDLMNIDVVNHRLELSAEEFRNMGESISYTTVGKYAVYEEIGVGGFGKVYKGFDEETQQDVAIKVIDIAKIYEESNARLRQIKLKLTKNEDLMMRLCNSPNLIKCYDVYENEDLKLMMIEYCNGNTLQNYIERKGRIPEKEAILIFKQILNGIAELHSHMIIHRDLKSQNVLIHNGVFKIADFGFSKQLMVEQGGTTLGTITNMAPEVMKRQSYGLKADIWSAGVIMFQMVFGEFPFESREKISLLNEISGSNIYKERRISFNGYMATVEMSNFLKQTIAIDKQQRIGWKQLLNHAIFKEKHDGKVPISRVLDIPLIPPSIMQVIQGNEEDIKSNITTILHKLNIVVKDSNKVMIKMKNKQQHKAINEDDQIYEWLNENLVECLKIELIYEEIISKIEANNMLDLSQREPVELMYLLTNRCFLDISPINNYMLKTAGKHRFINQTYGVIKTLYQKTSALFDNYSSMLTEEEKKLANRFQDFFKSKEKIEAKDRLLNGIQDYDFKKEEQVRFIQIEYINKLKDQLKGPSEIREKVKKYLSFYTHINMIQSKHLLKTNFEEYVQQLIS